jgi:cell division GTPase FtsZ
MAKTRLFNSPVIISLGSGGGRILSKSSVPKDVHKIALNSSNKDLSLIGNKIDVSICCGSGMGSGMSPEQGRKDLEGKLGQLFSVVDDFLKEGKVKEVDLIPVVATSGHGFGSGALPLALEALKSKFKDAILLPFVVCPFTFEGQSVVERSYRSLQAACKISTCIVISNQVVGGMHGDISASYKRINHSIGKAVSVILKALSVKDAVVSLDKSDLTKILKGDLASIRHTELRSAEDLSIKTITDGIGNRWLDTKFKSFRPSPAKLNVFFIADGRGVFAPAIFEQIQKYISGKEYYNESELKPLLINRNKNLDFIFLESGFSLGCGQNIFGEY